MSNFHHLADGRQQTRAATRPMATQLNSTTRNAPTQDTDTPICGDDQTQQGRTQHPKRATLNSQNIMHCPNKYHRRHRPNHHPPRLRSEGGGGRGGAPCSPKGSEATGTTPEPKKKRTTPQRRTKPKGTPAAQRDAPPAAARAKPSPKGWYIPFFQWARRVLFAAADQAKRKGKAKPRRTATKPKETTRRPTAQPQRQADPTNAPTKPQTPGAPAAAKTHPPNPGRNATQPRPQHTTTKPIKRRGVGERPLQSFLFHAVPNHGALKVPSLVISLTASNPTA